MRSTLHERLHRKFRVADGLDGCWEWSAAVDTKGYGVIKATGGRRLLRAHRVLYELVCGAIPDGLTIDHLCRNRRCVNPLHMEPVTRGENSRRGGGMYVAARAARAAAHCKRGHPFDESNTHWRPDGRRSCRLCRALAQRHRRATVGASS